QAGPLEYTQAFKAQRGLCGNSERRAVGQGQCGEAICLCSDGVAFSKLIADDQSSRTPVSGSGDMDDLRLRCLLGNQRKRYFELQAYGQPGRIVDGVEGLQSTPALSAIGKAVRQHDESVVLHDAIKKVLALGARGLRDDGEGEKSPARSKDKAGKQAGHGQGVVHVS